MPEFTCRDCGATFTLDERVLARYPGWQPRQCINCRNKSKPVTRKSSSVPTPPLAFGDLNTGVFTDGGASPNPGPGGWGAVFVVDGNIVAERSGHDPATTNNRMELTALIQGAALVPEGTDATVYSDSSLAVRTITEWAAGWEKRGWRRKTGEVENLDLVKEAYRIYRRRPELNLEWVKGHSGIAWNEYADELANRWRSG